MKQRRFVAVVFIMLLGCLVPLLSFKRTPDQVARSIINLPEGVEVFFAQDRGDDSEIRFRAPGKDPTTLLHEVLRRNPLAGSITEEAHSLSVHTEFESRDISYDPDTRTYRYWASSATK